MGTFQADFETAMSTEKGNSGGRQSLESGSSSKHALDLQRLQLTAESALRFPPYVNVLPDNECMATQHEVAVDVDTVAGGRPK